MITKKRAAMNVPSKAEALEENGVVPCTKEKKEFIKDFKHRKASDVIDELYYEKLASHSTLKDISCTCGYQGQPDRLGRCPECGNIGGLEPKRPTGKTDPPYSRSRAAAALQNDVAKHYASKWNFLRHK